MSRDIKFLGKKLNKMTMALRKKPVRYVIEDWFEDVDRSYKITLESFDKDKIKE